MVLVTIVAAAIAALSLAIVPSCTLDPMGSLDPNDLGTGGAGQACDENADCPGLFAECEHPLCANAVCGTHYEQAGASCTENEGVVCDGAGECVECVDQTQCSGDEICQANECVPAFCEDGVLNGDESDLDCGGSCAPCQDGQFCGGADDCTSGYCASNGLCAACTGHGDCDELAEYCCVDGIVDCEPGVCIDKEADSDRCDQAVECLSGFCPPQDGVCCDSACDGTCYACLEGRTIDGFGPGQCGPVVFETDPDLECSQTPESTCGIDGRGCDGAGACLLWPSGTVCDPEHCSGGDTQNYDDTCDGNGHCDDNGADGCSPYICEGTTCRNSCTGDGHCLTNAYCAAPNCVSDGNLGSPCGADNQCQSDHCVDGYCCDSACTGECMACSANWTDGPNGDCQAITHNTDPNNECSNGACYHVSDSDGDCRLYQGYSCGGDNDCMNSICRDGYCCETTCTAQCMACRADWSVGNNGQCRAIDTNTDPDNECDNGACFNNSGTGDCRLYVGFTCGSSTDCLWGNCVDSRCCENSCTSGCMGCRGNITVGSDGQCRNIIGDTDPNNDCQTPITNNCDGFGACQDGNGNTCSDPITCTSGYCEDGYCCNSSCSALCQACRGDWTVGSSGTCSNITTGQDYEDECSLDPVSSCDQTGECASGACQLYSSGTECLAPYCSLGIEYTATDCDGSGDCDVGANPTSCSPYTGCSGSVCASSCSQDSHCIASYWCDEGGSNQCEADLGQGQPCSNNNECTNDTCRDGYCCENDCAGECRRCDNAETGENNGLCRDTLLDHDPDSECNDPNATACCHGDGTCETNAGPC